MRVLESTCHGTLTRLPGVPSANLKPWPWKPTLPNQQRTSVFHGHQTPRVIKRDKDWLWLWCLKILACHIASTHLSMKWFGMASLAMASESEQCYSSRGPLAASLCQKPSCFNWKTEKFTKLRCARKMIWVHMGVHGFPFFSKPFCSFYMFSYQNSYILLMISRDPPRMRCWPRLGTWPRLLSIRGKMPTGAPSVNVKTVPVISLIQQ